MSTIESAQRIATIGSGASVIYLVKHIADHLPKMRSPWKEWHIYERDSIVGMGMPYNPHTTDRYNLANITSEELPPLTTSFAQWLNQQTDDMLREHDIIREEISEKEIYSRLALGQYLHAEFNTLVEKVGGLGVEVILHPKTEVVDISLGGDGEFVKLHFADKAIEIFGHVVISTGHQWEDEELQGSRNFSSPWPISKLLPKTGTYHNFPIGMLGASLSAFDVVTAIAHRHGKFTKEQGILNYALYKEAEGLQLIMHSHTGWLPHLQYEQKQPYRKIYRYTDRAEILALCTPDRFMRISDYFHRICRPVLISALSANGLNREANALKSPDFDFVDFVAMMGHQHEYENPFEGLRKEFPEAEESVEEDKPIYWKEAFDDLMYTLNFHMELLPAEDHLLYHEEIKPFLMNVIAALPLRSAEILLSLYDAGILKLTKGKVVDIKEKDTGVEVRIVTDVSEQIEIFNIFVGCGGDKPTDLKTYPFPSLVNIDAVREGRAEFLSIPSENIEIDVDRIIKIEDHFYLSTGGIAVDAGYAVINKSGVVSDRIFDLTFTHVSGQRPYSYGLQACDVTAAIFVHSLVERFEQNGAKSQMLPEVTKIYSSL